MKRCPGGIKVKGVIGGYYKGFKLGPVSFSIDEGKILAVVGPNASGKTTLLRILAGIVSIEKGSIEFCSKDGKEMLSLRPPPLSYVPSFPEADLMATPREMIIASSGKVDIALNYMPFIQEILDKRLMYLSSGQRRLACIARGFSTNPKILLIDEPMAHLDVSMQGAVMRALRLITTQGSVVVITMHELHLVPLIADNVLILQDGTLIGFGKPGDIMKRELLERIYNVKLIEIVFDKGSIYLPVSLTRI